MLLATAACALLSASEIARVQGSPPQSTKASQGGSPSLTSEQCFFALPDFARSISLEVTRGAGVRAFWRRSFHERHGDEDAPAAEPVRGLGDEAFWSGDPRLGGLFVLRRDAMLRLAVGGNDTKAGKLRKLKQLARYALKRL